MRVYQTKTAGHQEEVSRYEITAEESYTLSLSGGALQTEGPLDEHWRSENEVSIVLTFRGVVPPVVRSALELCIKSDVCRSAKAILYSSKRDPQLSEVSGRAEFNYAPAPEGWGINE